LEQTLLLGELCLTRGFFLLALLLLKRDVGFFRWLRRGRRDGRGRRGRLRRRKIGHLGPQLGFRAGRRETLIPPEGVKRIVAAGNAVGMHLESSVRRELERGTLVRLPIVGPALAQHFRLARRPNEPLSPLALRFAAFLKARIAAEFSSGAFHVPEEYVSS